MSIEPVSAALGIGGSLVSGIMGAASARRAKRQAAEQVKKLNIKIMNYTTC